MWFFFCLLNCPQMLSPTDQTYRTTYYWLALTTLGLSIVAVCSALLSHFQPVLDRFVVEEKDSDTNILTDNLLVDGITNIEVDGSMTSHNVHAQQTLLVDNLTISSDMSVSKRPLKLLLHELVEPTRFSTFELTASAAATKAYAINAHLYRVTYTWSGTSVSVRNNGTAYTESHFTSLPSGNFHRLTTLNRPGWYACTLTLVMNPQTLRLMSNIQAVVNFVTHASNQITHVFCDNSSDYDEFVDGRDVGKGYLVQFHGLYMKAHAVVFVPHQDQISLGFQVLARSNTIPQIFVQHIECCIYSL